MTTGADEPQVVRWRDLALIDVDALLTGVVGAERLRLVEADRWRASASA